MPPDMVRPRSLPLLLLVPLLAGCTDFDAGRQNYLFVQGIDVSAPEVGTGRLVLLVNVTVDNSEAESGDLRVLTKAFDQDTGLLVKSVWTDVEPFGKEETRIVSVELDLPRANGYRLEVDLYQDDEIYRNARLDVGNLANLEPNLHDSGLRVSTIDFEVLSTAGNRTSVRATAYLTNEGTGASRPLSLQLKAREVSTDLLVAQVWAQVGSIGRDATRAFNATLSLPDGYNYDVEAVLWDGEIVVERGVGNVQFAPITTVNPGQSIVVTRPNLDEFAGGDGFGGDGDGDSSGEEATPGPAFVAVLAVLVLAAFVLRRRSMR